MKLTGDQFQNLQDALVEAFPTPEDFAQMVRRGLDENLNTIAGETNLNQVAYDLIVWAEARDRVPDLVQAACTADDIALVALKRA